MKQVIQHVGNGVTDLAEVPCPKVRPGHLLIATSVSTISSGTERAVVGFGKANIIKKARQQPGRVREMLEKARTDGMFPVLQAIRAKLDQVVPLGYCNVGTVLDLGADVQGFSVGDRVVSNGYHAEVVQVPKNLCAHIPEGVSDETAAFTILASIALQSVRLTQPTLGERVVVSGLGLVGLLAVQILRANGCQVLGIDYNPARLALARRFGAETLNLSQGEDPVAAAGRFSRGTGIDAVILAAATQSNEPVHQAALMCRKRGRIVLVGAVGLALSRPDFYDKELTFQVSCSYGPGRYDPEYEAKGHDYPIGFVRWTEQRNLEAVLELMSRGQLITEPLISHRFELADAAKAYDLIAGSEPSLGVYFSYGEAKKHSSEELRADTVKLPGVKNGLAGTAPQRPVVGFIGAGSFAGAVLIPALCEAKPRLKTIASANGLTAAQIGRKFGFDQATSNVDQLLADQEINTVFIATRHDNHADLVCRALEAGKHVFVEKPLATTAEQLARVEAAYQRHALGRGLLLMTGFNRRFAPQVLKIKDLIGGLSEPKSFLMTVNAGAIPFSHWAQELEAGGGRIIGEGCHFIDLLRFLAGHPIVETQVTAIVEEFRDAALSDRVSFTLRFADGSFGTVLYLSNGHRSFAKERLEVFCAGRVLQLDNFRRLRGFGWSKFRKMNLWRQDKGHKAEVAAFIDAVKKGLASPIAFEEQAEVTRASFAVARPPLRDLGGKNGRAQVPNTDNGDRQSFELQDPSAMEADD